MKKILIVGPQLSLKSGVSHHVKTMLSSPLAQSYEMHYFQVGAHPADNFLIVVLKFMLNPFRFTWKLWSVLPAIVHFNPSFDRKSILRELVMVMICKFHNRRTIIQFHGGNISCLLKNNRLPFYIKLIFKLASHIIVLTEIQKKSMAAFCEKNKITVIPNMIDTSLFPKHQQNQNGKISILYMSKVEYKKGAFDVIEVISQVVKYHNHINFIFAGDGPDLKQLKLLCCENGCEEFIKFLGHIEDQRKIDFLSNGDIFLFPSHYQEGMPYALLEAMAAGLPVIATNTGGIPEIISHNKNGLLVPPGQPDQLSEAIFQLIKHPRKRNTFGKMNRQKAVSEFDINIVCNKFNHIYEKLSNHS
ncbi:MAG TPA: glycosyltransferase family 4 protein [bacterium]